MAENPWLVESIQEFYFLKCPECSFHSKEENDFREHAVQNHPLSLEFFENDDEKYIHASEVKLENPYMQNSDFNTQEMPPNHYEIPNIKQEIVDTSYENYYGEESYSSYPSYHNFDASGYYKPKVKKIKNVNFDSTYDPLKTYKGKEKPWHSCDLCDFKSQKKGKLTEHINAVHEKIKSKQCSLCDATFSYDHHLKRHVISVHGEKNNFKCTLCDASFSLKETLTRHIRTIHEGVKPHKCTLCDASFSQKSHLLGHVAAVHDGKKPYQCSICGTGFIHKAHLKRHLANIHGETSFLERNETYSSGGVSVGAVGAIASMLTEGSPIDA